MDLVLYTADFLTPEQLIKLYSCVLEIGCYSGLQLNIASCIEMKLMNKEKFHLKHTQLIGKIISRAYNIGGTECNEAAKKRVYENNSEMSIEAEKKSSTKKVDKAKGQNIKRLPVDDSKTKKAVNYIIDSNDVEFTCSNKRSRKIRIDKDEALAEKRQFLRGRANRKCNVVDSVKDQESKMELTITVMKSQMQNALYSYSLIVVCILLLLNLLSRVILCFMATFSESPHCCLKRSRQKCSYNCR